MGNISDLAKSKLTRRTFLQGMAAAGAAVTIAGCSSDSSSDSGGGSTSTTTYYRYGTSAHNCGGRCIIKAEVSDGKIVRFLTDESTVTFTGDVIDTENRNCTQSRACSKCRSYKMRLYHPGRLKYPLKQTKTRGDLSGFQRISWDEALNEISRKYKAITDKYGNETVHSIYACGNIASSWQGGGYTGLWTGMGSSAPARLMGGYTPYTNDYSFHQNAFFGSYTGLPTASDTSGNAIAGVGKNVVLWGSNILSTVNPRAYSWIKTIEDFKKRDSSNKVYFIGPEFVDTGVTLADEWIQSRPYTDVAVIMGMLYHMIDQTFDSSGNILTGGLDVDYIDTMVYGFFDNPEYWIHNDNRTIVLADPGDAANYTKVDALVGTSLAAYIMGSDTRLQSAVYNAGGSYVAKQFGTAVRSAASAYVSKSSSVFDYKKDLGIPKTPAWASAISGIPEDKIKELAILYMKPENHPIHSEWAGGMLKQAEGVITKFALEALMAATKSWGRSADGYGRSGMAATTSNSGTAVSPSVSRTTSNISAVSVQVTQWHNAIKMAFGDQLKTGGYDGKYIPDWGVANIGNGKVYHDDGGAKGLVKWKRSNGIAIDTYTDDTGTEYYDWEGRTGENGTANAHDGTPIYSGFRFIINSAGNILVNQHMNSNDSVQMYESLPIAATNPDSAEELCLVTLDNFLSPSARWSDYVLPGATTWEQEDSVGITLGNTLYIPEVIAPPGEAKSSWNFTNELLKAYEKVDTSKAGIATTFTGGVADQQIEDLTKIAFETATTTATSPYYGKTWEQFLDNPHLPDTPSTAEVTTISSSTLRSALDAYLADTANLATTPFTTTVTSASASTSGYGKTSGYTATDCPNQSGRIHIYSGALVWRYAHAYEKYHGYLAAASRGQNNLDTEGYPIVYPIPMYFNYQDYFREAYGLSSTSVLTGRYLLTTTHDRYRAHSSQSENPYLRELTHKTVGGGLYSGNDYGDYAMIDGQETSSQLDTLNRLINADGSHVNANATYSEIWINPVNAQGIVDGDLVEVWNEIGKVRCVARTSYRCVEGFLGLHQGCWYDPRTINGETVDVGGNCNTLMASKPSRADLGNAQQSAMVSIQKVTV